MAYESLSLTCFNFLRINFTATVHDFFVSYESVSDTFLDRQLYCDAESFLSDMSHWLVFNLARQLRAA